MLWALLFNLCWAQAPEAPAVTIPPARVYIFEGDVLEKGTRKPMADVNVFLLPAKLKATTDKQGHFKITEVPAQDVEIVVNVADHKKYSKHIDVEKSETNLKIYIERQSYKVFETTVSDLRSKKDDSQKTLKQEEFLQMPGSGGDPVKAVQNLPGVNRVGSSAQVVIQGAEPEDTRYNIDGHDVPLIFHFGGLSSIVTPEAVESVDYLSAGYGPQFGLALGGHVGLNVRKPQTDRQHGMAFMDLYNMGFLVEGPLSEDSSYLISGRYSYIGLVLKEATKNNKDFNLTVAPSFYDINAQYDKKLSANEELRIFSILSKDKLEFVLNKPLGNDPKLRGNFAESTEFYRFIPEWSKQIDESRRVTASLGFGVDNVLIDIGDNFAKINTTSLTSRAEYEQQVNTLWKYQAGLDNHFAWYKVAARAPNRFSQGGVSDPFSTGEVRDTDVTGSSNQMGLYWKNEVKLGSDSNWTLLPGLRGDSFSSTKETLAEPRLGLHYAWDKTLTLRTATGVYYQAPTGQTLDKAFGNPDLKAERAFHFAVGFDKDYRDGSNQGLTWSSTLFYKILDQLVASSSQLVTRDGQLTPENYTNGGKGHVHGLEMQLKYKKNAWGLIGSYTYSQSRRQDPGLPELPSPYDQTHSLNLLGSYEEGPWQYGVRFRYVTGNPYTPIADAHYDGDNDVYIPQRGDLYSQRQNDFMQLDFRVDRKWVYNTWILSAYLDIQNMTNRKNPEGINYSYDYKTKNEVTGLPTIPTLGVKGEF